jgi:hypothetical protein
VAERLGPARAGRASPKRQRPALVPARGAALISARRRMSSREIVGHSAIEVMMTIYAHVSLDEKRKALRKLGEALC